jgi:hypothetical protein
MKKSIASQACAVYQIKALEYVIRFAFVFDAAFLLCQMDKTVQKSSSSRFLGG